MKTRGTPKAISIILSVAGMAAILLFILTGKRQLIYDEFNFVPNIFLFNQEGWTSSFLQNIHGSAGPTYAIYHNLFYGDGPFNILEIRLANYFLLIVLLLFIFLSLRLFRYKNPLCLTLNFISVPFVWVFCGLGLTEIPAMTFAMMGFYFFITALIRDMDIKYRVSLAFIGGFLFSFAIMGRSFYLMAIIAILAWMMPRLYSSGNIPDLSRKSNIMVTSKKQIVIINLTFIVAALVLPVVVFLSWKGITPPLGTEAVGGDKMSIVPWHGILAFAYSGFAALILAPSWFIRGKNYVYFFLVATFAFVIFNIIFKVYEFAPLKSTMTAIFPQVFLLYYGEIMPGILTAISVYFVISTVIRLWQKKDDKIFLLMGFITLLILASTVKVTTQFSPRYVGQVTPFFLLLFAAFETTNWNKVIRLCFGVGLGFLSLYSYYHLEW